MGGVLSDTASRIGQAGVWNSLLGNVGKAGGEFIKRTAHSMVTPTPLPHCVNSELALVLIVVGKICDLLFGDETTHNNPKQDSIPLAFAFQSVFVASSIAADFFKDSRAFYAVIGIVLLGTLKSKEKQEVAGTFLFCTVVVSTVAGAIFLLSGQLTAVGVLSLVMYVSMLNKEAPHKGSQSGGSQSKGGRHA